MHEQIADAFKREQNESRRAVREEEMKQHARELAIRAGMNPDRHPQPCTAEQFEQNKLFVRKNLMIHSQREAQLAEQVAFEKYEADIAAYKANRELEKQQQQEQQSEKTDQQ